MVTPFDTNDALMNGVKNLPIPTSKGKSDVEYKRDILSEKKPADPSIRPESLT